jgi:hypothetical protein
MTTSIKVSGAWKEIDNAEIKVGGAWKSVDVISIKVGGVWKDVYSAGAFDISSIDGGYSATDEDGFAVTGSLAVSAAGAVTWTGDTLGSNETDQWWDPLSTVQGTWHVKLAWDNDGSDNQRSGGTADDTWTAVGSFSMNFSKASAGGPDTTTGNYTLSFSDDGGSTTHASVGITIQLTEQSP